MITVASNLTVHVHVSEETAISHHLITKGEYGNPFAVVAVGDAQFLVDVADIDRIMAVLGDARSDLAALPKAAA